MKILIADDDRTVIRALEHIVSRWGYSVVIAYNGKQALALLEHHTDITLAIVDWQMPELLGIDVVKQIRKSDPHRPLYVIMLTGKKDKDNLVEGFSAGVDDFVSKPFDLDILKARLCAGQRIVSAQQQLIERNESLDQEVKHRTRDLVEALVTAERASEMKSHFLANMSHEIRTPLNGILSYIDLLLYSELSPEQTQDLQTIRGCAHSLRTIINDVLDFSKIEAGHMLIEHTPFDVCSAASEVVELLKIHGKEKGLELVLAIENTPKKIVGDKIRFQQILTNLLSNAIKFSHNDQVVSVTVSVHSDPERASDTEGILLSVKDFGIGIPAAKHALIFESFTQADSSTTRNYGGTGLGLTIVRKLCELMDGSVWVDSTEGEGSIFNVTLPFPAVVKNHVAFDEKVEADIEFGGIPVLLAEDNLVNQRALKRMLEQMGCVVETANNGLEAVEQYKKNPTRIVLLDIQMPVMGGDQAAAEIRRATADTSNVLILALTADIYEHNSQRYLSAGIDQIMCKPIVYPQLFGVMKKFIKANEIA